jgi:hypothetical protein
MKTTPQLRPVYHRLEDRIRAHIILYWLALLLVPAGPDRRDHHRRHLEPHPRGPTELHVGTFEGPAARFRQRSDLSTAQRDILSKLGIAHPKDHRTRAPASNVLTGTNITAWIHTPVRTASRVPAAQTPESVSSARISCGTRDLDRRPLARRPTARYPAGSSPLPRRQAGLAPAWPSPVTGESERVPAAAGCQHD